MKKTCATYILASIFLAVFSKSAIAQSKPIDEVLYPQNKSFSQVTKEIVTPYFDQKIQTPVKIINPEFKLKEHLHDYRWGVHQPQTASFEAKLYGSIIDFSNSKITTSDKDALFINDHTTPEGFAITYALFDMGEGLKLKFSPSVFESYFVPLSATHLRQFTVFPSGEYWDKTYGQFCWDLNRIYNPEFYFSLIDFAIDSNTEKLNEMSFREQATVIDTIGISIAEYFLLSKLQLIHLRKDLPTRASPIYNAMFSLFYNHGVYQIKTGASGELSGNIYIDKGDCRYFFYDIFFEVSPLQELNERLITQSIIFSYPYDYWMISKHLPQNVKNNFFNVLDAFIENPDLYTPEARIGLKKIIINIPSIVSNMNVNIEKSMIVYDNNSQKIELKTTKKPLIDKLYKWWPKT